MAQDTKIAGEFTVTDWRNLSDTLRADMDNTHLWEKAFEYFEKRLKTRYLNPIKHIEENGDIRNLNISDQNLNTPHNPIKVLDICVDNSFAVGGHKCVIYMQVKTLLLFFLLCLLLLLL